LFNVQRAIFKLHGYSEQEQIQKYIEMRGRSPTFDCHCKSMVSWAGTSFLVFCRGYETPPLFRNLQIFFIVQGA